MIEIVQTDADDLVGHGNRRQKPGLFEIDDLSVGQPLGRCAQGVAAPRKQLLKVGAERSDGQAAISIGGRERDPFAAGSEIGDETHGSSKGYLKQGRGNQLAASKSPPDNQRRLFCRNASITHPRVPGIVWLTSNPSLVCR